MNNVTQLFTDEIKAIIWRRNFFREVEDLRSILLPIKKAILALEHKGTTLVDCFIQLIVMVAAIKDLPEIGTRSFRNQCQSAFDKRWHEFNFDLYLLAFFLHPYYRGIYFYFYFYFIIL